MVVVAYFWILLLRLHGLYDFSSASPYATKADCRFTGVYAAIYRYSCLYGLREESIMKWSDDYATGIQRIDDIHKMMFLIAEDFRAVLDEGSEVAVFSDMLETFRIYANRHFDFAERCMCPPRR